jgi:hypothetical protein
MLAPSIERIESAADLDTVKRIFVEQLGGGQTSDQMRDMIISALQNCGLFVITENHDRADATLRGSSDDIIFTENHNTSDSIGLHANTTSSSSSKNYESGVSSSQGIGAGITNNESSHIEERRHESAASLRLVDNQGDVIWSTTQESAGGKFRGAMADVADKVSRQLAADVRKARASAGMQKKPADQSLAETNVK